MSRRLVVLLLASSLAVLVSALPAAGTGDEPRWITWAEAVEAGHPAVRDFERPNGMPVCPPVESNVPGVGPNESIPDDAPVCWTPPEQQGLRLMSPPGGDSFRDTK